MLQIVEYPSVQSLFRPLLTAEEAYPALEREFMAATSEIWASFRIFDPTTKLRSPEAQAIGRTWFDLIIATLQRGVSITLVITDFDPLVGADLHRMTWRSIRQLIAAAEIAGPDAKLRAIPAMHPARTGLALRLLFWPVILGKQVRAARWLNRMSPDERKVAIREMPGTAERLVERPGGRFRPKLLPLPCLYPATHHQKLAVFDRKRLYIGGLDLDERRFDTPRHDREADDTWHDVQLLVDGPAVREAQEHLESFLHITAGERRPASKRRVLRTISEARTDNLFRFGPKTLVQELAVAHEHLARRAKRLIYIETQFFRDLKLARYLATIGESNPELGVILIMPGAPEEVAFERHVGLDARYGEFLQSRALRILKKGFGNRLFVGAAAQPRVENGTCPNDIERDRINDAPLVYIHSKVSIFDESAALVSSANLNGRSLRWDTEAGLFITSRQDVRALRQKVMRHWLPEDAGDEFLDPVRAVGAWRTMALENARKRPAQRRGFILPYDLKAAEEVAVNVAVVPEEMV